MKVKFLTPLNVTKLHNGRWLLSREFCFQVDGQPYCVPQGFETDFASVPRLPFAYLLAGNTSHEAAVIHDWMYADGFKRPYADQVFRAALQTEGVADWRRWSMWVAVRIFGSWSYDAKRKAD